MLTIDGSRGEGGGQVLRTALALAAVMGTPFRIEKVRAGRAKPGLLRQHLTAVEAARAVSSAEVDGAAIGSTTLEFRPGRVTPGVYEFSVGTAGSATLILQTVLPALMSAPAPSDLTLEGGTHNPFAPPFEFLAHVFLPALARMGPRITAALDRHGFYPAGGGRFRARIEPAPLTPIDLVDRGPIRRVSARILLARLPRSIGDREAKALGLSAEDVRIEEVRDSAGPGNAILVTVESESSTELITSFGEKGRPAESVAQEAARETRRYADAGVPVGEHLADQLILPMALAGGGSFVTLPLSSHAETNIDVVGEFLPVDVRRTPLGVAAERVEIRARIG